MNSDLFFAVRDGLIVAHNLTPLEVLDIRFADPLGRIEIIEQGNAHPDNSYHVLTCPHCAAIIGERVEKLQLHATQNYNISLKSQERYDVCKV